MNKLNLITLLAALACTAAVQARENDSVGFDEVTRAGHAAQLEREHAAGIPMSDAAQAPHAGARQG